MTGSAGRRCCRAGPWRSGRGASAALPPPPPPPSHATWRPGVGGGVTFAAAARHRSPCIFRCAEGARFGGGGGMSSSSVLIGIGAAAGAAHLRRWRRRRHHFPKRALPHKGGGAGPPGGGGGGGIPLASAAAGAAAAGAAGGRGRRASGSLADRLSEEERHPRLFAKSGERVGDGEPRRRAREQDRDGQRHLGLELLSALRRRCFADVVDDGRLSYGVGQRVDLVDRAEEAGLGVGVGLVRELGDQPDASVVDLRVGRAGVDHPVAVHQPSLHHRVSRSRIRQQLERQLGQARAAAAVSRALERDDRRRVARSPLRRALHLRRLRLRRRAQHPHLCARCVRPSARPPTAVPSGAPPWTSRRPAPAAAAPTGSGSVAASGRSRPRPRAPRDRRPPPAPPPALPPAARRRIRG